MASRIIELWGRPRVKKQKQTATMCPQNKKEIVNLKWPTMKTQTNPKKKKKKRSWNKPNKKKNCQEVCQIKQILSTSSPCVWKNVFGMAACQNLLSSPTCMLVCLFCQSQIQISLCVEWKLVKFGVIRWQTGPRKCDLAFNLSVKDLRKGHAWHGPVDHARQIIACFVCAQFQPFLISKTYL